MRGVGKVTVQEPLTGSWRVTSNHKVNKYRTDLLFLIKNVMWDSFNKEDL